MNDDIRHHYKGRVRGSRVWKPQKKTQAKLEHLFAVLDELADYWPVTIRYIFYRLVGRFGYKKTDEVEDAFQYIIDQGRRSGLIPWEAIDDGRSSALYPFEFGDADGFTEWLSRRIDRAQLDRQANQLQVVEVWCEAVGTVSKLKDLCGEYGVPIYTSSGYNTTTIRYYGAMRAIDRLSTSGRTTHVLHLGDHDDDGVKGFNALAEDVEAWCEEYVHLAGGDPLVTFERLAVLPSQVEEHVPVGLREKPKSTWNNWKWEYSAQLESLSLPVLLAILRDRLDEIFDGDILQEVIDSEPAFRDELRERHQVPDDQ